MSGPSWLNFCVLFYFFAIFYNTVNMSTKLPTLSMYVRRLALVSWKLLLLTLQWLVGSRFPGKHTTRADAFYCRLCMSKP